MDEHQELAFNGTPYDFGGAVADFIGANDTYTGCTFTLQPNVLNYSVEIECPADDGEIPAFVWLTARRIPGGKSKLVIDIERYDYDRSSRIQAALAGLLNRLKLRLYLDERTNTLADSRRGKG